ncbi:Acg family FMN-binding oxidoreductase [Thermomonospora echinospora]|uniref:Acg family FMN-binding oxidoreductase n=1 Tax=Thermomonospora echinospora TaxID=1992 RepID=UPI000CDEB14F|nr:nitroreductase family protein [Thermomonospora echinospora]
MGCVDAAVQAPSIHNSQPWQFLLVPGGVEVHSDPSRRLPAVDPQGRSMHISLGAAVLNLRLAVRYLGRREHTELLPDPRDRRHVATVRAGERYTPGGDDEELYEAIPHRRSNRSPFEDVPPPPGALEPLITAAAAEGAELRFLDQDESDFLLYLALMADERRRESPAYRRELYNWVTDDPYRDDGIPLAAVGPWTEGGPVSLRDLAPDREVPGRASVRLEREPTVAVLTVRGEDAPPQWLRAGQAMQRVWLDATRRGLAVSVFTTPLEDPELRDALRRPSDPITYVAFRLGYAPPAAATPRRPVDEVIAYTRPVPIRPPHLG